jgi:hypothetical protein
MRKHEADYSTKKVVHLAKSCMGMEGMKIHKRWNLLFSPLLDGIAKRLIVLHS